ncbi:hypothetical protein Slala03_75820 [Streptomyces lavendulae subsp. lavendulae]|nr:hypothetical protein Slala03_75820 [Streptomyces lavendulae subsp. lavendulae]
MTEYGFIRASDEVLSIRNKLADEVIRALQRAGLPAFREGESGHQNQAGAVIHVEPDAETMSASVSVEWRCSSDQLHSALEDLTSGLTDTPTTRYPGTISLHMQIPLIKILLLAGIIASPNNDNMNPSHILIFGRTSDLPPGLRPTFVPPGT